MDFQGNDFKRRVTEITGRDVAKIEYPGGKTRDTVRLVMEDGGAIIATSRKDAVRSTRELQLLYALAAGDMPAPRVIAVEEGYFLQSSVGGLRLSELLNDSSDEAEKETRLAEALNGLRKAQIALADTPVGRSLEALGPDRESALYRAGFPQRIARRLGLSSPDYDPIPFADLLTSRDDAPIKFDSRPANALLGPDDQLIWIDWDRAGRRNLADDLVSLLFDEYTAIPTDMLDRLIARHAADFQGPGSARDITEYVRFAGLAQCCYRIGLILSRLEKDGHWGDPETCLRKDRIGTAPKHVIRLCDFALHMIGKLPGLDSCAPVFETLKHRSETRPAERITEA